jgi:hypothetical protein
MLRVYRALLYLYPAVERREFGTEMVSVFAQLQSEFATRPIMARLMFRARELSGLLSSALESHLRRIFGFDDWARLRRFDMRAGFRFPRSTIFLMCVIFAGVMLAIEKAKAIQMKYDPRDTMAVWSTLPWSLVFVLTLICTAAAVGWGILFALRRTGVQRLSNVQTWPEQR